MNIYTNFKHAFINIDAYLVGCLEVIKWLYQFNNTNFVFINIISRDFGLNEREIKKSNRK